MSQVKIPQLIVEGGLKRRRWRQGSVFIRFANVILTINYGTRLIPLQEERAMVVGGIDELIVGEFHQF